MDIKTDDRGVEYVERADLDALPIGWAQCGTCGYAWNDAKPTGWTPVPSGRCPFEYDHETIIAARLEELRAAIQAENISYGEIAELQGLAEHIEPGDVELLEWAGVEENEPEGEDIRPPLVVVVRDPDADNDYTAFGGAVDYYDIDAGKRDLRNPKEYADWKRSHFEEADRIAQNGYPDAALFIRQTVLDYGPDSE